MKRINIKPKSIFLSEIAKEMHKTGIKSCLMEGTNRPWYCRACIRNFRLKLNEKASKAD